LSDGISKTRIGPSALSTWPKFNIYILD